MRAVFSLLFVKSLAMHGREAISLFFVQLLLGKHDDIHQMCTFLAVGHDVSFSLVFLQMQPIQQILQPIQLFQPVVHKSRTIGPLNSTKHEDCTIIGRNSDDSAQFTTNSTRTSFLPTFLVKTQALYVFASIKQLISLANVKIYRRNN